MTSPENPRPSSSRGHAIRNNCNTSMESMLAPDLQDWLKLSGWHEMDYREKKLAEYRGTNAGEQKRDTTDTETITDAGKNDRDSAVRNTSQVSPPDRGRTAELGRTRGGIEAHRRIGGRIGNRDPFVPKTRARSISPFHRDHDRYRIRNYPRAYHDDYDRPLTPGGSPLRYIARSSRHPAHYTERIENYDCPNKERAEDQRDLTREMMNLRSPGRLVLGDKGGKTSP
ncbi:hypothetical protein F4774DRAFT_376565 [Daldinia eschscholtzii]|nr:hypothetical protein F4774DRAFT_376565 [Daldinia eschscholtzii]